MNLTPAALKKVEDLVCERFAVLRKERGLTQEDFDQEPIGVPTRTIQRIESKDVTNLELKTLLKLAFHLKMHPKDLLDVQIPWERD